MDCLEKFKDDWPREGILQIQIIKNKLNFTTKKPNLPPYFASKWNWSLASNATIKNDQCSLYDYDDVNAHLNVSKAKEIQIEPAAFMDTVDDEYLMKRETVFYEKTFSNARYEEDPAFFPNIQHVIQREFLLYLSIFNINTV